MAGDATLRARVRILALVTAAAAALLGAGAAAAQADPALAEAERLYSQLEDEEALRVVRELLASRPGHVAARELEARCLFQLRRPAEARAALEGLARLSPRGRVLLADCRAEGGEHDLALAIVDAVLGEHSRLVEARLARARILIRKGALREASQEMNDLRRLDPDRADLVPIAARWLEESKRFAEALPLYESIVAAPQRFASLDPHVTIDALEGVARLQFQRGDYEAAERGFADLVRRRPGVAAFHYRLGMAQGMASRALEAIESLRRALELDPEFHECRFRLAELYRSRHLVDESIAEFERLRAAPEHRIESARALAELYAAQGELEQAAACAAELEAVEPKSAALLEACGLVQEKTGRAREAIASYRRCLELDPLRFDVVYRLALLLLRSDDAAEREEGARWLERHRRVVPVLPDLEAAVAALQLSPGHPHWMVGLASILNAAGEHELARSWIERALRLRADDAHAQAIAGCIAANQGRDAEALAHFERALALAGAGADSKVKGYVETLRRGEKLPLPLGEIVRRPKGAAEGSAAPSSAEPPAPREGGRGSRIDAAAARASHERMKRELAEIEKQRDSHPFLGRRPLDELLRQIERLPPDAPLAQRLQALDMAGYQELALGETRGAIARLEEALALATRGGAAVARERQVLQLHLGTAYLRLAEDENCVHCATGESCLFPIRGSGIHTKQEGSRAAMRQLAALLESVPEYPAARWLLNVAAMTVGEWPDGVPERQRIAPELVTSQGPFPRFKNIARQLGLDDDDLSGGAVAEDFDNDGLIDLLATCYDVSGRIRLYRNEGDGRFTERAKEAGLEGILGGLNAVQADYDDDGFVDVLVLRGAWCKEQGRHPPSLLRNNGDGTFVDVTFAAGLGEERFPTQTAAFADFDRDGDLDLYIGAEASPGLDVASRLYRNEGDGTFADVTEAAGVANRRYAKGVSWGDFDEDGWPDLYVSNQNQGEENRLYRNRGDGTFVDVAAQAGVTRPLMSFPTWFFDYDNDGHLDLFVASYNAPAWYDVAASWLGQPFRSELACLYRGDGRGGFADAARSAGLERLTMPMGSNFGDLDNDGWLDVYLGTGTPRYEAIMPNVMLHNRGGVGFADVSEAGGFGHLQKGHGVAFADFDNDGDQDVFEQMGGALPGDRAPDVFFLNPGFGHRWLKVKLVGVRSSRCAIGARLRVEVEEDGTRRSIYKHVNSGGSFGANPLRQELGLGRATRITALEVRWPATGEAQTFRDVPLDSCIEVTEGVDEWRVVPLRRFSFER